MSLHRESAPPSSKSSLQHRLEFAAARLVTALFRAMPPAAASTVMGKAWRFLAPWSHRHRRALEHLALALPELPERERRRIAVDMWENLGRVAGEAMHVDRLIGERGLVRFPGDFDAFAARARNGGVFATLHLGNWELAAIGPAAAGLSLAGVYQPIQNPLVEKYLKSFRQHAFPAGLFAKGASTGRRLVALAKGGGAIGCVADVRERRGISVTFFGQPAFATPLPAMLARLAGVPLVAGCMVRTKGMRFEYRIREIEVPRTEDRSADIHAATQALHDVFEEWIREAPEQWMWAHRKWASAARPKSRRAAASLAASSAPADREEALT